MNPIHTHLPRMADHIIIEMYDILDMLERGDFQIYTNKPKIVHKKMFSLFKFFYNKK